MKVHKGKNSLFWKLFGILAKANLTTLEFQKGVNDRANRYLLYQSIRLLECCGNKLCLDPKTTYKEF